MRKNWKYLYAFFYVWVVWAMPAFAVFTLADVQEMKSLPLVQLKSNESGDSTLDFFNEALITGSASWGVDLLRIELRPSLTVLSTGNYIYATLSDLITDIRTRTPSIPLPGYSSSGSGDPFVLGDVTTWKNFTPSQFVEIGEGNSTNGDLDNFLQFVNDQLIYTQQFPGFTQAILYTIFFYTSAATANPAYTSGYSFSSLSAMEAALFATNSQP